MKQKHIEAPEGMRWSPLNNCFVSIKNEGKSQKMVKKEDVNSVAFPWKSFFLFIAFLVILGAIFK